METRAGTSVLLSLCIVALTTVALYRPEPTTQKSGPSPDPDVMPASATEQPEPELPEVVPLPEPTAGIPLPTPAPAPARGVAAAPPKSAKHPAHVIKDVSRRRPNSAFTSIGPGETLPDVATRIYGTPDAADALFRANRDVLSTPADPLQVGGMLRTP